MRAVRPVSPACQPCRLRLAARLLCFKARSRKRFPDAIMGALSFYPSQYAMLMAWLMGWFCVIDTDSGSGVDGIMIDR